MKAAASAIALGLALAPAALLAQSESSWRLPGATVRPAPPGSQGPVDRDNPVVTTAAPRETPTPTASPAPSPAASQPAATPTPTSARPASGQAPRPAAVQPARPAPGPVAAPVGQPGTASGALPVPSVPTGQVAPALPTDFAATPPATTPALAEPAAAPGWYWPWIAGAAALLAAVFALLWWRRRKVPATATIAFERPIVPVPRPVSKPAEPLSAAPAPAAALPDPLLSLGLPAGLGMTLEARRMSASLMATTLSYVVTLTNTGTEPLSALAVEGDMVSAHASLPPEQQIAGDGQRLELRHALVTLAPGESAEFTGDFRLPLASVTPIRAGEAAYFVPLARLRVEASTAAGQPLVKVQTYVVGEIPEVVGAALRPFRLDLGPRTYNRIGQRAVN